MSTNFDTIAAMSGANAPASVAAEQKAEIGKEGASGKAVNTAPKTKPMFTAEAKLSKEAQAIQEALNDYELNMAPNRVQTIESIDTYQQRLYNEIRAVTLLDDSTQFMACMEMLFDHFREDKFGVYDGTFLRRRLSFLPVSDSVLKSYQAFLDMLQVFSDPLCRRDTYPRYNRPEFLAFVKNPEKRSRLETYMGNICR